MNRRRRPFALLGVLVSCLWVSSPALMADQVILSLSAANGGANDVRIESITPDGNYVSDDILSVYHRNGNDQNSLLLFDLGPIPSGKMITSATLTVWRDSNLFPAGDNGIETEVFRLTKPWIQWQATWNNASGYRSSNDVSWDEPGGDFIGTGGQKDHSDPYAIAALYLDDDAPGVFAMNFDVSSLVSEWYNGVFANYGFLLTAPQGNGLAFHADRGFDPTLYPTLTVAFQ
jgi:hypothetical protein